MEWILNWPQIKCNIKLFVTQVIAIDQDSGSNGDITYNILKQNQDQSFNIDNQGYITTRLPLDFEIKDKFTIEIEAMDHGMSSLTSTCEVRIRIIDVNDQQPYFPSNPHPKNISEGLCFYDFAIKYKLNSFWSCIKKKFL